MDLSGIKTKGLKFTPEGVLILDKTWSDVGFKILDSHLYLRNRVNDALKEGKYVLVLPGSYDLLHAGHVTWFEQASSLFLQIMSQRERITIERKDIFIVVPIDTDALVNVRKRSKHISQGGKETVIRPIVSLEMRSLALANLEIVDLVVPIPSPLELERILEQPQYFTIDKATRMLNVFRVEKKISEKDYVCLAEGLKVYQLIRTSRSIKHITQRFKKLLIPSDILERAYEETRGKSWKVFSWQLMWYLYFADNSFYKLPQVKDFAHRIVSLRDSYHLEAEFMMRLAGISINSLMDRYITSTTQIISSHLFKPQKIYDILEAANMRVPNQ